MTETRDSSEELAQICDKLLAQRVDGVICAAGRHGDRAMLKRLAQETPTVLAVRHWPNSGITSDPQFADATRSVATWDLFLGGAGTEEAGVARLFAAPTLARTNLYPYLRAGFMPQSLAYRGTAPDGDDNTSISPRRAIVLFLLPRAIAIPGSAPARGIARPRL